jgi:hypothetical protein
VGFVGEVLFRCLEYRVLYYNDVNIIQHKMSMNPLKKKRRPLYLLGPGGSVVVKALRF